MESTIVIKVKYEETLRRFNARVVDGELDLNMVALREKIIGLFKFTPNAEVGLTYVDEDNDIVTLADDDDLHDVVRQALNPLRITVKLSNEKSDSSSARTSGISTPLRSPRLLQPFLDLNSNVLLKSVPEPIRRTITKICTDLGSTDTPSAQTLIDLVQCLSELGLPYLNQISDFQAGANTSVQDGTPMCTTNIAASQDAGHSNADGAASDAFSGVISEIPSSTKKEVLPNSESRRSEPKNENSVNANGGVKAGSFPGLEALTSALEATNPKPSHTVQIDTSRKIDVDYQSGGLSSEKFVDFSSSSVPPVSNTVTGENKEPSDKPNKLAGTNFIKAHAFPWYPANVMWSNLNSQVKDSSGEANSAFQSSVGNSSSINFVPNPMNECPFMGVPLENSPAVAPQIASKVVHPRRNHGLNDGPGIAFHRGVCCDGCGVHPITGPRFKSKVKDDYDLCNMCFVQMGNENDYIRIDRPVAYRHPYSFKGLYDFHNRVRPHPQPPVLRYGGAKLGRPKLDSRFIQDVNILDGTIMAPSTQFTKIWRMRNDGSVVWPQGTQLVWIGGDKLSDKLSVHIEIASAGLPIDQEHDVAVDFVAPDRPGRYISYWRMAAPSGQKFGQRVWVLIQVDAALKELPHEGFRGFNLNLPPASNGVSGPEIINVNPEPMVEDILPEVDKYGGAMKLVEKIVDASPEEVHEVNFPINDTLLVGGGAVSSPVLAAPSSLVSYPIVGSSEVATDLPAPLPSAVTVGQTSAQHGKEKGHAEDSDLKYVEEQSEVEETLLKGLKEMGFKEVDLNKEILRLNEYDFGKSVEDLCGVADWDPILEELRVMGFCDKAKNQKLLKKNNGSIMRVVMDLLAGKQ